MVPGKVENLNNENASPTQVHGLVKSGSRNSISGGGLRKSLIPKPVTSPSGENENPSTIQQKTQTRRPFSSVQNTDSPKTGRRSSEKVAPKPVTLSRTSLKDKEGSSNTPLSKLRLSSGVPKTPQNSPSKTTLKAKKQGTQKETQTGTPEEKLVEKKEDESVTYWKDLAESRREALEDALKENYELHQRVEELQKEKAELEELVKEGEKLAMMIADAAEELDESGICEGEAVDNQNKSDTV